MDNNISLTISDIEKLLIQKYYIDNDYQTFLNEYYDKRYIEDEQNKIILTLLYSYYEKYQKIPSKNIFELIIKKYCESNNKSEKELLLTFKSALNYTYDDDEKFIQDQIKLYIQKKSMYYAMADNIDYIEKNNDISKCIEKFQKISNITFDQNIGFDYYKNLNEHFEIIKNPESRISTGYKLLDKYTNGGLYKDGKCLFMIVGGPHLGKSMTMSNFAVNFLSQNLFPIIITLEMSEHVYGTRIDSALSNIAINELQFKTDEAKEKILKDKELYPDSKLLIKEFPTSTLTSNALRNYIKKAILHFNRKPDVIIVDYINLMKPNEKSQKTLYEKIGSISEELRSLSYDFNAPIISCTQTNRSAIGMEDNQDFEHISESSKIAATADFIAFLHQTDEERKLGEINLLIRKNRLGGIIKQSVKLDIDYRTLKMSDHIIENFKDEEETNIQENVLGNLTEL